MSGFNVLIISTILSLGGSFFIPGEAGAQAPDGRAPFNASEVVERASHHPVVVEDRIVIRDKAYEAEFSEGKAILKAREGTPGSEDVVIPVSGRPEVRDGKVVYSSWEGEVEFEGGRRGLRYQERDLTPYNQLMQGRHRRESSRWMRDSTFHFGPARGWTGGTTSEEFLLDTNFVYLPDPSTQQLPAIAFDGRNYMLVWQDERSGYSHIYGARVSPGGVLLDSAGIPISPPPRWPFNPSIAFDGVNYLVVWDEYCGGHDDYNIYGARVTPGGAVLDPDAFPISTDPKRQEHPAVTFGGSTYLVVWYDESNGLEIYGARVTPAGRVLDPNGFPITTGYRFHFAPAVAFDQRNFMVVWGELHDKSSNTEVYGARVTQSGVVLDTAGIAITNNPSGEQEYPKVAFDGSNYLVSWVDARSKYWDIYGARVNPGGVVLDTEGIAISTAPDGQWLNSLTFDGRNYLFVWFNFPNGVDYDVYGTRVSPSGVILDTLGIPISTAPGNQWFPVVAFDRRNFLVVWQDRRNSDYEDIYGARVTPQGIVLDTAGLLFSYSLKEQRSPAVAFDGRNYLAVWQDGNEWLKSDIYGTRVSPTGGVLDPARITISVSPGAETSPDVVFDGRNYLVVWEVVDTISNGVYGVRVNPDGLVLDPNPITIVSSYYYDYNPTLAFDGRNYLVVYQDYRGGSNNIIYGARVTPSGVVLDTNGIALSPSLTGNESPRSAFDGRNYLVAWKVYGGIRATRVTPNGVVLDPNTIVIESGFYYDSPPVISFDGRNYLVIWTREGGHTYGARVTPAGVILDPNGFPISTSLSEQNPKVAFDGNNYTVVWQDYRNGSSWDIYGVKLNPSGVVIDSFPVSLQRGDQMSPDIVHGIGDQFLVAFTGFTDSINGRPANAMRIWGKLSPWSSGAEENGKSRGLGVQASLRLYPNPFREKVWISAILPSSPSQKPGSLKLYDITGRQLVDFSNRISQPGPIVWDGTDGHGLRLPGGVYFFRLEQGGTTVTKKVILLR
jgi:hypothetical protein